MWDEHLARRVDGELHADDCLDDDVFYALHQLYRVDVVCLQVFQEGTEGPLVPLELIYKPND